MVTFLLKRICGLVAVLMVISLLVFSLLALSPGSVLATLLGTQPATPEMVAAIEERYHLNDPFLVQYRHWLVGALQGDFGASIQSGEPVTQVIAARLPVTIELALYASALVVLLGIPAGMLAGFRSGRATDRIISGIAVVGMSAPGYAVAILLIYLLGVRTSLFPVFGAGTGTYDRLAHLTLPAVALAIGLGAVLMRQTRAAVLDVMSQDYVTFARARGLGVQRIVVRYALRNTAVPVVTAAGLVLVAVISGAVLVETIFSLSGVGQLMVEAVTAKDVPVVQGLAFFTALLVVLVNLVVDLAVLAIDPRTRTASKGAGA